MATTREDIARWIKNRPATATHMLVTTDTYDHTDFPVYFTPLAKAHENGEPMTLEDVIAEYKNLDKMSKVMEVYSFTGQHAIENQLHEYRAWHTD